ncbi:hypothetical protein AGIG_G12814 [Arapaima gigas]
MSQWISEEKVGQRAGWRYIQIAVFKSPGAGGSTHCGPTLVQWTELQCSHLWVPGDSSLASDPRGTGTPNTHSLEATRWHYL